MTILMLYYFNLRYYDAELSLAAGPEEMKWPEKGLYTLGIRLV